MRLAPKKSIEKRHLKPFGATIEFTLNGSIDAEDLRVVYTSPRLDVNGYTLAEAYVGIQVISDTAPGNAFGLIGGLSQSGGSAGAIGPIDAVSQGIVGLPVAGKNYVGVGTYRFNLFQGGGNNAAVALANDVFWTLSVGGQPANRVIEVKFDGVLVAGEGFGTYRWV